MPITLIIYTKTEKLLISKAEVEEQIWKEKLYWYTTSLVFDDIKECVDFLKDDFHLKNESKINISATVSNHKNIENFELCIDKRGSATITPLQLDLLNSRGEIIDWIEWFYFFSKNGDKYQLWVYLGGIAEQVREINLSEKEVNSWTEQGSNYIKRLASELAKPNSKVYLEAIQDSRKIL